MSVKSNMRLCKNCGPLPPEQFATRSSGYIPNVCRSCERKKAAERRRETYADAVKRLKIQEQNAAWRAKNSQELADKARLRYGGSRNKRDVILRNVPNEMSEWAAKFSNTREILDFIRKDGFLPYPEPVQDVFKRLNGVSIRNPLPQLQVGLSYLDNINPHRYDSFTEGKPSLSQAFNDDAAVIQVVNYILKSGREPTRDLVLRNLKFNVMMPSHFFPSAATAVINEFAKNGAVIDPFLGWGGRILGFMCSSARSFTGTDLNELSVVGARRIVEDFSHISTASATCLRADFSEFLGSTSDRFDLILTSPPFFDTENYGVSKSRGRDWVFDIAKPLVDGAVRTLTPEGAVAIHAQDRPKTAVLSIILACFLGAGFEVACEYKYGKRPGQAVLIFKKRR